MKRIWTLLLMLIMCCMTSIPALAGEEGTIVQSSCNIVKSGDYYLVYCYAQVHNDSDQIICLDNGTFELTNGEQLLYSGEVSQLWPYFIAPGEDGYLVDLASFEPNEDGVVVPNVTGLDYNIRYMTIDPEYAGETLTVNARMEKGAGPDDLSVICEIHNPTDIDAYDSTVSFGLYTAGDVMIYADGRTISGVGIPAGGTTLVRFDLDELFVSQWNSYGAMPARVNATAMFRGNED